MNDTLKYITIARGPIVANLEVLEHNEKSIKVRNTENNHWCYLPKKALMAEKLSPVIAAIRAPDETMFEIKKWFHKVVSYNQERALNWAE